MTTSTRRGNYPGGGKKGACGGERRRDGSGGGRGNFGTRKQPKPVKRGR